MFCNDLKCLCSAFGTQIVLYGESMRCQIALQNWGDPGGPSHLADACHVLYISSVLKDVLHEILLFGVPKATSDAWKAGDTVAHP